MGLIVEITGSPEADDSAIGYPRARPVSECGRSDLLALQVLQKIAGKKEVEYTLRKGTLRSGGICDNEFASGFKNFFHFQTDLGPRMPQCESDRRFLLS
jgi:hypothetical protein